MPDSIDPNEDPYQGEPDLDLIAKQIKTFDAKPDLKPLLKHGVFLWWSDQLPKWIHPDDLELAQRLVPGCKIFRREVVDDQEEFAAGYFRFVYGQESFRAFPIVWLEVQPEGFEVGDRVEVKSRHGKRSPGVATIRDITWGRNEKVIQYFLERNSMPLPNAYTSEEIRPAPRLGEHLSKRELDRLARS